MEHYITSQQIKDFAKHLREEERAPATIAKYVSDTREFAAWLGDRFVTKETAADWKSCLLASGKAPVSVNTALAALHSFFAFAGWTECRVKYLKIQRQMFRDTSRELTREEYQRLVQTAEGKGNRRLALLLETICATGIRVSEVRYITVEAVRKGRADISMKGKIRSILMPGKLARKLQKYARKQKIASGEIFITKSGKGMSRRQIWADMKSLCQAAGVDSGKVFPHNLRHVFARAFYHVCGDIVKLADVLGHSSIETTRLYLMTTGAEHVRQLDRLGLVSGT